MLPAHQGFDVVDKAGFGIDFGLVVQNEFTVLDGIAQLPKHGQATHAVFIVLDGIHGITVGVGFRAMQRTVRALHEQRGIVAMLRKQGDTAVDFDFNRRLLDGECPCEEPLKFFHGQHRDVEIHTGQQHRKFVGAEARNGIGFAPLVFEA